jgi:hypothetical protein
MWVCIWGIRPRFATLRGPKKRAKTDRADARLLRTLLLEGRFPESWIAGARAGDAHPGPVVLHADGRAPRLAAAHPRPVVPRGLPASKALLSAAGRDALAGAELSAAGRQYVDTALRRIDELTAEIDPLRMQLVSSARTPGGVSGKPRQARQYGWARCAQRSCGPRLVMPAGFQFRSAGAFCRARCHRVFLGRQTLTGASIPAGLPGAAVGHLRGG